MQKHAHPSPAVYTLPDALFGDGARSAHPLPVPDGFQIKPTPAHGRAFVANLHILIMGPGYPSIVGRLLPWEPHVPHDNNDPKCWWALELISFAYCVRFQAMVLDLPGVRLCPLGDPPTPPPGAVFNFYQRKAKNQNALASLPAVGTHRHHPTDHLSPSVPCRPRVMDAARADGCIGLLAVRPPPVASHGRCALIPKVEFFARVAYGAPGKQAQHTQAPVAVAQRVTSACMAALRANPFVLHLNSEVLVYSVQGGSMLPGCPRVLWDQAPVPEDVTTTVIALTVSVSGLDSAVDMSTSNGVIPLDETDDPDDVDDGDGNTNGDGSNNHHTGRPRRCSAYQQTLGDCLTRFMVDMMLADSELAVVPQKSHVALSLFTNKTPGLMNVRSAMQGVPITGNVGSTPRPIKDVHPTCAIKRIDIYEGVPMQPPVAPVRDVALDELMHIPLFQQMLLPSASPLTMRGFEVSVYSPMDGSTLMAGTRHSWVCLGALTYDRIMRPYHPIHHPLGLFDATVSEEARRACFELLHPALYNVTTLETFWNHGRWSTRDATRREFWRPYALDNVLLTGAVFWVFGYPGFVEDWVTPNRHVPPTGSRLDVWHLKTYGKAYLEFAARFGRIVRMLLNNRARNIRRDYSEFVLGTYFCATGDDQRPMRLVDTFDDCIVLGESRRRREL